MVSRLAASLAQRVGRAGGEERGAVGCAPGRSQRRAEHRNAAVLSVVMTLARWGPAAALGAGGRWTGIILVTRHRTARHLSHPARLRAFARSWPKPGSNPGSGINKTPANPDKTAGNLVQLRTNAAREGTQKVVARPDTGRYEDRLAPVARSSNG